MRADASASTNAPAREGTVLAFDFGTRKIGVALGNTLLRSARALTTIRAESSDVRFAAIAALIEEWSPVQLVVGAPVHADGTAHDMTRRAERFARQLEGRFGLPVALVDERYTTRVAAAQLASEGIRGEARRAVQDEVAATLILQAWFDEPHRA